MAEVDKTVLSRYVDTMVKTLCQTEVEGRNCKGCRKAARRIVYPVLMSGAKIVDGNGDEW